MRFLIVLPFILSCSQKVNHEGKPQVDLVLSFEHCRLLETDAEKVECYERYLAQEEQDCPTIPE